MTKWNRIVVGVDGSEGSRAALSWAAEEARQHDGTLVVVTTWAEPPISGAPGYGGYGPVSQLDFGGIAKQQQAETIEAVLGTDRGVRVEQEILEGHPARQLLDAAVGADLLVVGSRGHGGFAGMLLGSVSQHVSAHAPCPVVVVR